MEGRGMQLQSRGGSRKYSDIRKTIKNKERAQNAAPILVSYRVRFLMHCRQ